METNINTLSAPQQNFKVEENKYLKDGLGGQKKKKTYISASARNAEKKEGNKTKRLCAAAAIIFAGIIFLARNFGILEFNFLAGILMIWPLVLIIIGISIAIKDGWWPVCLAAATLAVISAMTIMLAIGFFDGSQKSQIIESDNGIIIEQDRIFN